MMTMMMIMIKMMVITMIIFLGGVSTGFGDGSPYPDSSSFFFRSEALEVARAGLYDLEISVPGPGPFPGLLQSSEYKDQ